MKISILADHRWRSGSKTYAISATLSFFKVYELLKDKLKDLEIELYVMTFGRDGVEYYKVDFGKLYELYKERKIKEIIESAIEENYYRISKRVGLDEILKGLSNSDFIFISSAGFWTFDNNLTKRDLDNILSEKGNYLVMVHPDYDGNHLTDLWTAINYGKLNLGEETKRKINDLFMRRVTKGYLDDNDQIELINIIKRLVYEDNEEARKLRESKDYRWIIEAIEKEIYTLSRLKYGIALFATNITLNSNNRYIEKITGSGFRKAIALDEPMFMISLWKNYKDEIKAYKGFYLKLYENDNRIKLIYVGRNHPERGIDDIIKLYKDLLEKGKDVILIILSPNLGKNTEEYKKLEEIVKKYKRGEVHIYSEELDNSLYTYPLHLIGFLEAIGELGKTIYINPTYMEGYGLATLEALIIGRLPIILYRDIIALQELKNRGILSEELAFKTYEELYNLVNKIIEEIESGKFNIQKYINEEKIKEISELTDPEKVAEIYAEIIYNYIKENYNNLENQKAQEDNVNS